MKKIKYANVYEDKRGNRWLGGLCHTLEAATELSKHLIFPEHSHHGITAVEYDDLIDPDTVRHEVLP